MVIYKMHFSYPFDHAVDEENAEKYNEFVFGRKTTQDIQAYPDAYYIDPQYVNYADTLGLDFVQSVIIDSKCAVNSRGMVRVDSRKKLSIQQERQIRDACLHLIHLFEVNCCIYMLTTEEPDPNKKLFRKGKTTRTTESVHVELQIDKDLHRKYHEDEEEGTRDWEIVDL